MPAEIGQFYPQGGSRCIEVEVSFDAHNTLLIKDRSGELLHKAMLQDCRVEPKLGGLPREVHLPQQGLLTMPSSKDVDAWLAGANPSRIDQFERSSKMTVLSLVLVPLFIFVMFKYALPQLAVVFADAVPDAAIEVVSQQTLWTLDKAVLNPSKLNKDEQEALGEYWRQKIALLPVSGRSFNIQFRDSSKLGANAFALPDGTIVFTDQLVELFDKDKALLTSVLLHEIGHVEHQHSMRLIAETLVTTLALSYFFGDVSGLLEMFGGVTNTIVQNQFTQKLEWEADNYALANMASIGLSAQDFANAMRKLGEKIGKQSEAEQFMQSHPLIQQRIENAIKQAEGEAHDAPTSEQVSK
ncbi:M48 family metallopeptidase [Glaciecola siphonariae]|uniref:M48 family metallopeptidase n=1 Tax=Glaciecola siphonariae TaxID=521012 RepID=A0ABV9M090_9ALTE